MTDDGDRSYEASVDRWLRCEPEELDEFDPYVPGCCGCSGPLTLLGALGRLTWWRCRDCGLDQSTREEVFA